MKKIKPLKNCQSTACLNGSAYNGDARANKVPEQHASKQPSRTHHIIDSQYNGAYSVPCVLGKFTCVFVSMLCR